MNERIDIYHINEQVKRSLELVEESGISKKNKELIKKFYQFLIIRGLASARILKYLGLLRIIAGEIKKDFDKTSKTDIESFIGWLEGQDLKPWTKYSYKVIIKRFYKWLKGKDEIYPEQVRWIKCQVKRSELKLPEEGDLINEKDMQILLSNADHPRDKALISCLYESGCRIFQLRKSAPFI